MSGGVTPIICYFQEPYAAVTQQDRKGIPKEGFHPEESITHEQALRAMGIRAARAATKVSPEPGKHADMVITMEDIIQEPSDKLYKIQVMGTWSGGLPVYSKD